MQPSTPILTVLARPLFHYIPIQERQQIENTQHGNDAQIDLGHESPLCGMRRTDDARFVRLKVVVYESGIVIVIARPAVIIAGVGRLGRLCIGRLARVRICFEALEDLLSCLPILKTVLSLLSTSVIPSPIEGRWENLSKRKCQNFYATTGFRRSQGDLGMKNWTSFISCSTV